MSNTQAWVAFACVGCLPAAAIAGESIDLLLEDSPDTTFFTTLVDYDASTDLLTITNDPFSGVSLFLPGFGAPGLGGVNPVFEAALAVTLTVDEAGVASSGALEFLGSFNFGGEQQQLLEASGVVAFGQVDASGVLEVVLNTTGGLLAEFYGEQVGLVVNTFGAFDGSFASSFSSDDALADLATPASFVPAPAGVAVVGLASLFAGRRRR